MNVTNQSPETDSMKVTENQDGTFTLEWDPDDAKWSWLNGLTEEQVQIIMEQAMRNLAEELDEKEIKEEN